jgi:diguanylate cyclase (GGDEF)-like protein/PAS domain S-box-containing protein/putative nucleotidyltransferase with HDIG domain
VRHSFIGGLLTNSGRFTPDHPDFRRAKLLNILILLFFIVALLCFIIDVFFGSLYAAVMNGAATILCGILFLYFHKSNKIEVCSYIIIGLALAELAALFVSTGYQYYILVWISIFPPLVFFLLNRKKAVVIVLAGLCAFCAFILINFKTWSTVPTVFNFKSAGNIIAAVISLTLIVIYFDLSRRDAVADALQKNTELNDANRVLAETKDQLRLILDSTAEAIFGVDVEGQCTFCNASCLKLLGYTAEELIGKDMHTLIHSKRPDGTPLPRNACNIIQACTEGVAAHADNEVFWNRDNVAFDVDYYSYPQYKDGKLIGAVVTFTDNTLRKIQAEQIRYYSSHDSLTGLLNRSSFEAVLQRTDILGNLPLSIIMGDLNGLKLTNDVFGHAAGDGLLRKASAVLKKVCREDDMIARLGGDEFVILLPRTQPEDAQHIIRRIQEMMGKDKSNVIRCSMSLGCDTKVTMSQPVDLIMKNAENNMYQDKSQNRNKVDTDMINAIIMTLYKKFPLEEQHSLNVSELCRTIGEALGLPATEITMLRRAGLLHDIGKVRIGEENEIPYEQRGANGQDDFAFRQHPAIGYRIINLFDSTVNIAEAIYNHHENWDGTGFPRGLKGEEIPLAARIIAVAERYDHLHDYTVDNAVYTQDEIISTLRREAGTRLDPGITETLITLLERQVY